MKTINEIMRELAWLFGENYDVRLVPSIQIRGGHICRATIQTNRFEVSHTHRTSYRLALNEAFNGIDRKLADAAEDGR